MSSKHLRAFINERLAAAAVEIFAVVQQTIVQYEEELDRQRKQLQNSWKPEIEHLRESKESRVDEKKEVLREELFHNQDEPSPPQIKEEQYEPESLDIKEDREKPAPARVKEEQDELCAGQEGDRLALKQEPGVFVVRLLYGVGDGSKTDSGNEYLLHRDSPVENLNQARSYHVNSESSSHAELNLSQEINSHENHSKVGNSPLVEGQSGAEPTKKSAKCRYCGKVFKRNYQLKEHHRIHTGEKPYPCKVCGKSFRSNDKRLLHMRIHTGEKPYACKVCGKSFRSKDKLLLHTRTHTGEKPYLCNTCGKRFTDPSTLRRHVGIHTDKKPFSCETCGKSFRLKGQLTIHLRIHTGEKPFTCTLCGKGFRQTANLKSHMRIHTGEKR